MGKTQFMASALVAVLAAALLVATAAPALAAQVNISFDGLPQGTGGFPTSNYQEAGFTMTGTSLSYSNILPGIIPANVLPTSTADGATGTLEIRETNGTDFQFISLVLGANGGGGGPVSAQVTGFNGAATVATDTFNYTGSTESTYTAVNLAGKGIDRLVIVLSNQPVGAGNTLVARLDSIRLQDAPPLVVPCGGSVTVSSEAQLNEAIAAFNANTCSGNTITIELANDINLTGTAAEINGNFSNTPLVIDGKGFTVDGARNGPVFRIPNHNFRQTDVTMKNITITNGASDGINGGGITSYENLTLIDSTVTGNSSAWNGGGILAGGASSARNPNDGDRGKLTLIRSTVSGNTATGRYGLGDGGLGNAIYAFNADVALTNSTVSGNTGGRNTISAINTTTFTTLTLTNSTVAANEGAAIVSSGRVTFANSLLANNQGNNCAISGTVTSNGYNLSDDASCPLTASGDIQNGVAKLAPLADYGGPTQTHALQTGSAALDAIDATCNGQLATLQNVDQRGVTRPVGSGCDIGAFEGVAPSATPLRFTIEPPTVQSSPVTNAVCTSPGQLIQEDFDDLSGAYSEITGRPIGKYSSPGPLMVSFGQDKYGGADTPNNAQKRYLEVELDGSAYTLDFTAAGGPGPVGYFGFWWSAGDGSNILEVTRVDGTVETFTTQSIINSPNLLGSPNCADAGEPTCHFGNPTAAFKGQNAGEAYAFVNIYAQDAAGKIASLRFRSTGAGFETDNQTICTGLIPPNQQSGAALGGIVIRKETGPAGASGFQFADNIASPNSFTLNDSGEKRFLDIATGTYEVTESDPGSAPGGFSLVDLTCVDGDPGGTASTVDLALRKATIHLDRNETVACVFTNEVSRDYGDAPDSYGTTKAANGAYHFLSSTLRLGNETDGEADGFPGVAATGDDLNQSPDDEDAQGALPNLVSNATNYTLNNIPVINTGGAATLYGWLDANRDGQFETGERTSISVPSSGNYSLTWNLNGASAVGRSYVRLRLSDQTNLGPIGPGGSGEVEDYPLEIINTGTIIIEKQTAPDGGTSFIFSDNIESPNGSFVLDDGQSKTFANVAPGTYTVSEVVPNLYKLTDLRCDDGGSATPSTGNVGSATATINLDPNETVTCTFINSEDEVIAVKKVTIPAGGTGFDFTDNIAAPNNFSLDDSGVKTFTPVAGTYTITETTPGPTYDITGISCNIYESTANGSGLRSTVAGDTNTGTVTLPLTDPGLSATCVYTNTRRGTLVVVKETLPDGDAQAFDFVATGPDGPVAINGVTDGDRGTVANARPGVWELAEIVPGDWDVTNIKCKSATGASKDTPDLPNGLTSVDLAPGDTVICTFTNRKEDHLTITKVTVPSGWQGFGFTATNTGGPGTFTLDDIDSQTLAFTTGQTAVVVETDPTTLGYALTGIRCDDYGTSGTFDIDVAARKVEVSGPAGLIAGCTYTNTQLGGIIIEKVTRPNLTQPFNFTQDIAPPTIFSLSNGGSKHFTHVLPGRYQVAEGASPGVALTGLTCDDRSSATPSVVNIAARTATINVDPGEVVTCRFTNTQEQDTIIIKKETNPGGDAVTAFTFTSNLPGGSSFTLKDGEELVLNNVPPNVSYTVTESDPNPAYDLRDIACFDTATQQVFQGDVGANSVTFTPKPGRTIQCNFVNQARGKIVIRKAVQPADSTPVFSFTNNIETPAVFGLSDGGSKEFLNVPPGQYTVEELPSRDARLAAITCVDKPGTNPPSLGDIGQTSTGNPTTRRATINLDAGETVECTFTNAENDTVLVGKFTDPAGDTATDFSFSSTLPGAATFPLKDGEFKVVSSVPSGQDYSVTEADPTPGYDLTDLLCVDTRNGALIDGDLATRTVNFTAIDGHVFFCGFLNTKRGSVTIAKTTVPAGSDSFDFVLTGQGVNEQRTVTAGISQTIDNLVPGAYVLVESDPTPGYDLTAIDCVDDGGAILPTNVVSRTATINLQPGENVTCTFTNQKRGEVRIRKKVTTGPTGPFDFLQNIDANVTLQLNGGDEQVFSNVAPGSYLVQESDVPAGSGLVSIACDDGTSATPSVVDENGATVAVNVDPGETVTCEFVNGEAKVRITESFLVSRVEEGKVTGEGSIACYWITLTTAPYSGSLTVAIGPPAQRHVEINKQQVVLDARNWNNLTTADRSNFVCIRPIDDKIADGGTQICRDGNSGMTGQGSVITDKECGDHTDSIAHTITRVTVPGYSTSTPFERLKPDGKQTITDNTVPVLIQDNDSAGVVLTESYGVSDLDEDGTPVPVACYCVTLTSRPTGEVTVTPQPDGQVTVRPSSIVINHLTWNALGADSNKICIYPMQDSQAEGTPNQVCADKKVDLYGAGAVDTQVCGSHLGKVDHSFSSSDANYNGNGVPVSGNGPDFSTGPKVIDVLIRDDETPGLIFKPAALNVLEGGAASYNVALRSQPTQNVAVTALGSSVTAAGVDATPLTFTPQNWNVPQAVSLTVPDDSDVNGIRTGGISHGVSSGDGMYNGLTGAPVTLPMTITDDDAAGAALNRGSVAVAEGGASDSYAVRLTIQPAADVVVTVDGAGQVTANPSQLTFTPANWNVAQTVTVTAIDDAVDEGSLANATVRHTASSSDPAYNGAAIADLLAEITDNDTAALAVGNAAAPSIAEGASTTYGLALATQPMGPVQVFVVTDGKTTANPAALSFDASNWNVAQVVTLTGADDDVDNAANVRTSLVNHAAVSGDAAYNGVIDEGLSVDVVDNDMAAIRFTERNVRVAKGGQATVGVTLATRPLASVVVELKPSGGVTVAAGCAEASEGVSQCLVFTPDNWNVAQTLTLTALTDAPEFIDHLAASADEGYNGLGARLNVNGVETENPVFLPLVVEQ